jgi:hypothetical protein
MLMSSMATFFVLSLQPLLSTLFLTSSFLPFFLSLLFFSTISIQYHTFLPQPPTSLPSRLERQREKAIDKQTNKQNKQTSSTPIFRPQVSLSSLRRRALDFDSISIRLDWDLEFGFGSRVIIISFLFSLISSHLSPGKRTTPPPLFSPTSPS